ncbi:GNAT family N-acetyltransferase [Actinotignum urinale]|uniref:GNAT family N-acetyltransferase n=1 Tax=Actinotignum urinale TaxID=190146 RepID=UPI000C8095AC|nr:GNAT family N-acetyltransferase [Actinotignum urinale]WIK59025.1 GNAT family N-acetyltransferase [Actinotignum urinale]
METVILHTQRFVLTPPCEEDIPAIVHICQDPEIQKWTSVPSPYGEEDATCFVANTKQSWRIGVPVWYARYEEGGEPVACIEVRQPNQYVGELGFWTAPGFRDQGIMSEVVQTVLDFAFDEMKLEAVHWACQIHDGEPNWPSVRTAWKAGFVFEGIQRAGSFNKDKIYDTLRATIKPGEPRAPREPWCGPTRKHPAFGNPRDPETLVRQFHETYRLPIVEGKPSADNERIGLRMSLIAEEFTELVAACYGGVAGGEIEKAFNRAVSADDNTRDIIEIADAMGDLIYVIYGMALELGVSMERVLATIQASNLSKLGEDGKPIYREDGKVLKGPNFFDPDIRGALGL